MSVKKSARSPSRKSSPGSSSPADRLIEAAETLYGVYGLEGVSLRQIGNAAGNANHYAVQYHFGSADGLIEAILLRRIPTVDARQKALLEAVKDAGRETDVAALVSTFFRPLLEQENSKGERAYARFTSAVLRSTEGQRRIQALYPFTPTTDEILRLLCAALPHVPHARLMERLRLMSMMVFTSVFNRFVAAPDPQTDASLIDDALAMAAAAIAAPISSNAEAATPPAAKAEPDIRLTRN